MRALLIDTPDQYFSFLRNEDIVYQPFPKPGAGDLNGDFDIDKFIHQKFIEQILLQIEFDVLILPYSLTDNILEFVGLRLALHIRLTKELGDRQNVPIIFIGSEDPWMIGRLTPLGDILCTEGCYWCDIDKQQLNVLLSQIPHKLSGLKDRDTFLKRVKIAPPSNYQSHHSIDNELALVRWSEYLNCDDKISEVKENLQKGLYFKYHNTLNPVNPLGKGNLISFLDKNNNPLRGNILLIDDEANKGWKDFYQCFFKNSPAIKFDYLNEDLKSLSRDEIIEKSVNKIKDFAADVILLDLRLCDFDFSPEAQNNPKTLTGYKILEEIKKINKGIQTIITTASNKVWNYESVLGLGANGYIIKRGDSDVAEDIKALKESIINALQKASFLKEIYRSIQSIKNCIAENPLFDSDNNLRNSLYINYDLAFELLERTSSNYKYFNYAYLQLFLCNEEFLKIESVFEYGDKCYVNRKIKVAEINDNDTWKSIIKYNDNNPSYWTYEENSDVRSINTDFKMSSVLIFLFNQDTSNFKKWPSIRDTRNKKAAHPDKGIVTKDEIIDILKFQECIFNKENLKDPSKNGLSDDISETDIDKLKEKFGSK